MNEKVMIQLVNILKNQVKPALGCTEPVAVGLAVATACREINGKVEQVVIRVSSNIFKNGLRVGIPGTGDTGLAFGAALAAVCGNPEYGLEVFRDVTDHDVILARKMTDEQRVSIEVIEGSGFFLIEADVFAEGERVLCVIRDHHTNVVKVVKDGQILWEKEEKMEDPASVDMTVLHDLTLQELRNFSETVPFKTIDFMLDGVQMNMAMAQRGLTEKWGLGVGAGMQRLISQGVWGDDLVNHVRMYTAAACDARMAGINLPVMSSAGSGNHGITVIVPLAVFCREQNESEERLARALAFSHLITAYIKEYTGRLSPVCGCGVAAGIGAAVGIAWLSGGNDHQIAGTVKNMVGSISGMICDGAKGGCAFKLAAAASEAVILAQLAVNQVIIGDFEGIVGLSGESTIRNLGNFCMKGMSRLDDQIIEIMQQSQKER